MVDWIAFDADDTLWKNEETYLAGREVFSQIMTNYDIVIDDLDVIDQMEIDNIQYYGFGAMSFVLSLIEMAIQFTEGKILAEDIQKLLDHGKWMLSSGVEVFNGVEALLTELSEKHQLMMITKGDLFHQQRKIKSSGLGKYFQALEVVSDKSPQIYQDILDRYHISPENFVMVGNSLRSDILPVLTLGCWAIYLKQHLSWSYEDESIQVTDMDRYLEVNEISQVKDTVERILS